VNLSTLYLYDNQLADASFLNTLSRLTTLDLGMNHFAALTLPPGGTNLTRLDVSANPLQTLTLPDAVARGAIADTIEALRDAGVTVITYPLAVSLSQPQSSGTNFAFQLTGPPGTYAVLASRDLAGWATIDTLTKAAGAMDFSFGLSGTTNRFFRAQRMSTP
jgi:hypothetical protein